MKLKYTKSQLILESIAVILLVLEFAYLIVSWSNIPDIIPAHYNTAGIVDRWGNKNEILIVPIISVGLYILLTIVSFFPSIWNVPVKITEENREVVYLNLKTMLILIKVELIITFGYIFYCGIRVHSLGIWFLPLGLIAIFGTIIYFIIKVYRI